MKYNQFYHSCVHNYLINDIEYYLIRAKISFLRYFSNIPLKNKKILEYGCGMGQNIFLIKNQAKGYDISKFALKFCKQKGIKIINNKKFIKNNFYDIILSSHVLEHLENPLNNLKFLNRKLKKGGLLILIIPLEKNNKSSLNPDLKNYHLYSWTFKTINNLLHKAGFKVLRNEVFYGTAYHKLKFLARIRFFLYLSLTTLIGRLLGSSELKIIAEKK
ncbi:MAG: class I SAM-dependent methyltransferase [Candidatus Pacearchaeota archaeon]